MSQSLVSLLERGHLDAMTVRAIRRIGSVLEIQLPFAPRWRGGDGARLLDAAHAQLVDDVVRVLRTAAWEVVVEYTFSHFGERGSVDVLAWHPRSRALLVVEVKSRLLDTQATLAGLDRKARLVPRLVASERNWQPIATGVVLAMPGMTANRSAVQRHAATFAASYPDGSRAVRTWIRRPTGRLAGLWFLSLSNRASATRVAVSPKRVRSTGRAPGLPR